MSYYRRYTAQSLICLQSTDDDANLASKKAPVKKDYKDCTSKEELRAFYASLTSEEQKAQKQLVTEFGLTLQK